MKKFTREDGKMIGMLVLIVCWWIVANFATGMGTQDIPMPPLDDDCCTTTSTTPGGE